MADWNTLFTERDNRRQMPETAIENFAKYLEYMFKDESLTVWDLCCGAGRHTAALAQLGFNVYASDVSTNGLVYTKELLESLSLNAELAEADMTVNPWPDVKFHGVICWDAMHHNTIGEIKKSAEAVYNSLMPGGVFMGALMSDKAYLYKKGREIEPKTLILEEGKEAGVPHHYFGKEEILSLFPESKWEPLFLAEEVTDYLVINRDILRFNPFRYTKWRLFLKKRA